MDRNRIYRFDADFNAHDVLGHDGLWNGPHSLDFAADGQGIVTCYYRPGIYVLGDDRPLQLERALTGPASALFDQRGRLLIAEYSQNAILAFERAQRWLGARGRYVEQ
jgi:hypothetical protein